MNAALHHFWLFGILAGFSFGAPGQDQLPATPFAAPAAVAQSGGSNNRKVVLFWSEGFPTTESAIIPKGILIDALAGFSFEVASTPETLNRSLETGLAGVLVLPYGSAFPVDSWLSIRGFLKRGGSLVVLGGAPFHQPVRYMVEAQPSTAATPAGQDGRQVPPTPVELKMKWVSGTYQPSFARELLLGPAEEIIVAPSELKAAEGGEWESVFPRPKRTFALTVRLATRKDSEKEDGSAGPRDAVLRPLVHVLDREGFPIACPLLEIDRLQGDDAGARWVLAPIDAPLDAPVVRSCLARALDGAVELDARPVPACVDPGETPRIRLVLRRPGERGAVPSPLPARIEVKNESGNTIFETDTVLEGPPDLRSAEIAIRPGQPLAAGLYRVEVQLPTVPWRPRQASTGFWVMDRKLLSGGPRLSVSSDWIRKNGRVFPVIGTTYMASDVHRKFLFEPDPARWDRDFARMATAGVNFVRTGLWTGWSRLMLDPGAIDDNALRALDAFVLTAARHGIVVCFTAFAFQPPTFGGDNPFLDPRARDGQRTLLSLIARRFRDVGWVHYDLINEPSYSPPDALWTNRPMGDPHERAAWEQWVAANVSTDPAELRDRWRDTSADPLALPRLRDLSYAMVREDRTPRKVFDFVCFNQEVVAGWAKEMAQTLKTSGGDTLVTLGQDEAGAGPSPSPQFYASALDYTAVHTWWNNDDLLWDALVTHALGKPHLVQETGLMRLENADGFPWRTPLAAAELLERKFAFAFAGRGCGVVQWAWNINPYQPIDNEAVIGFIRPDGTAKPELKVLQAFASFFAKAVPALDDFAADAVVVVIPHSRLFSGRLLGQEAVRRVVRVLSERYGVVPAAVSDLRLTPAEVAGARLIVVPSPEMLPEPAAAALLGATRAGVKALVTGPVEGDPYGRTTPSLGQLGIVSGALPLALREPTPWRLKTETNEAWATFNDGRRQFLRRAAGPSLRQLSGNIWHEPLPLELAAEEEPLAALLGAALRGAGLAGEYAAVPVAIRVLETPSKALVIGVNDTAVTATRQIRVGATTIDLQIEPGRAAMVLLEKTTGKILAKLQSGF